jgi:dTMP kinase
LVRPEPGAGLTHGRFITFEGGEGAGKSTQLARLADRLRQRGEEVVATREPGGTPGAEAIRALLVAGAVQRWSPLAETFLHVAARIDHVERVIRPARARGVWMLSDRFLDSTRVYQGLAAGVGRERIDRLHDIALAGLRPDLTLLFDLPVAVGLERAGRTANEDRYERMGTAFHERVRAGFLDLAMREPERFVVIDANRAVGEVEVAVWAAVRERLAPGSPP